VGGARRLVMNDCVLGAQPKMHMLHRGGRKKRKKNRNLRNVRMSRDTRDSQIYDNTNSSALRKSEKPT